MNKKDIKTLVERYEEIYENSIEDVVDIETSEDNPKIKVDDFIRDDEVKRMFMSNLASIRSHAHSIIDMIDDGKPIQAWMADKIAVAAEDIRDVADGIDFRY